MLININMLEKLKNDLLIHPIKIIQIQTCHNNYNIILLLYILAFLLNVPTFNIIIII